MFKPKSLLQIIVAIVGFVAALITILAVYEPFKPTFNQLLEHSSSMNSFLVISLMVVAFALPFQILNSKLFYTRSKLQNVELEMSAMASLLEKSEQLRMTDVVTQIPNQEQFFVDLERIVASVSYASPYQLIFIDLIKFGEINQKYGYPVGDKIIEYFAQSVSKTMRRCESIYKMPFDEDPIRSELWQRAYRKHTGGDEFLFLIGGTEAEAVGFLVRLQRDIVKHFNHHIQSEILVSSDWSLSFSGAIVPIFPNDNKVDLFQRAHEGMRIARQPGSISRVFWSSKTTAQNVPDGWAKTAYEEAALMFGVEAKDT